MSCLIAAALAENGENSLYRYAGALGGFHWMSESQPLSNDCTHIQPGFAQSEHCGPGNFRAEQANVEVVEKGFKLIARAPTDPQQVTNAQVYMCVSEEQCAALDGTTDMPAAVTNQRALGPGTFVYQIDSFNSSLPDGTFPSQIVLGLYLYKPNMNIQGNVDCTDELDIEFAGWGGRSTVAFTTWPPPNSSIGYSQGTNTGLRSEDMIPGCAGFRWTAGTSVQYGLWKPVNGACDPEDCFGHPDCNVQEHRDAVPTDRMIPSLNLWWVGEKSAVATGQSISVIVSDFKYVPEGPTPAPTPAPVPPPTPTPTPPAPTPSAKPMCCWSPWGDEIQCAGYSGPGGRCNTDWTRTCVSDSVCAVALV